MRLLFDEQVSDRLPERLADCILTTKDEDFHRLSVLRRHREDVIQFAEHPEATFLELGGGAAS